METFKIEQDIRVYYITASSFPDGVLAAHQKLHGLVTYTDKRNYFGISNPDPKGTIIYKAAAEELEKGELSKHGLNEFIIPKGEYHCIAIADFMEDLSSVGRAFNKILSEKNIDPNGFCLEWYMNQRDVKCMVRIRG